MHCYLNKNISFIVSRVEYNHNQELTGLPSPPPICFPSLGLWTKVLWKNESIILRPRYHEQPNVSYLDQGTVKKRKYHISTKVPWGTKRFIFGPIGSVKNHKYHIWKALDLDQGPIENEYLDRITRQHCRLTICM